MKVIGIVSPKNTMQCARPELKPRPLDLEASELPVRPLNNEMVNLGYENMAGVVENA